MMKMLTIRNGLMLRMQMIDDSDVDGAGDKLGVNGDGRS